MAENTLRAEIEGRIEAEKEMRIASMKPDIENFYGKLGEYCRKKGLLEVEIQYKAKEATRFGFFGVPLEGDRVVTPWLDYNEIQAAWIELLTKWIFTDAGEYLIQEVKEMAPIYEFSCEHSTGLLKKDKIRFWVK